MRRTHRRKASGNVARLDLRRTLRTSMRTGGEIVKLCRPGRKLKPRTLVLICDISGSMDVYTRMLLYLLHAIHGSGSRSEVFVFGTRLTRITQLLRHESVDAALTDVTSAVRDWSGGTRIGDSLATFNRKWARRTAAHRPVTVIISDGWDRGDPMVLTREIARLSRLSYRLLWLNPMSGSTDYEPLTQGMRSALPFVDVLLPAHNLVSLTALASELSRTAV